MACQARRHADLLMVADRDPLHMGFGNLPDQGLYGLSAFRADGHRLLVAYGMTELFLKGSDDQPSPGILSCP